MTAFLRTRIELAALALLILLLAVVAWRQHHDPVELRLRFYPHGVVGMALLGLAGLAWTRRPDDALLFQGTVLTHGVLAGLMVFFLALNVTVRDVWLDHHDREIPKWGFPMRLDYRPAFLVNLAFGALVFILAGYSLERQVRRVGLPRRAPLPSALLSLSLVAIAMLHWTDPVQLIMEQLQIQDRTYSRMVSFLWRLRFQESFFYLACALIGFTSLVWIVVDLNRKPDNLGGMTSPARS